MMFVPYSWRIPKNGSSLYLIHNCIFFRLFTIFVIHDLFSRFAIFCFHISDYWGFRTLQLISILCPLALLDDVVYRVLSYWCTYLGRCLYSRCLFQGIGLELATFLIHSHFSQCSKIGKNKQTIERWKKGKKKEKIDGKQNRKAQGNGNGGYNRKAPPEGAGDGDGRDDNDGSW